MLGHGFIPEGKSEGCFDLPPTNLIPALRRILDLHLRQSRPILIECCALDRATDLWTAADHVTCHLIGPFFVIASNVIISILGSEC